MGNPAKIFFLTRRHTSWSDPDRRPKQPRPTRPAAGRKSFCARTCMRPGGSFLFILVLGRCATPETRERKGGKKIRNLSADGRVEETLENTPSGEDSGVALGAGALPFWLLGISLGQRRWPAPHSPVAHVPRAPPPRSTPSPSAGALACGRSLAAWRQRSAGEGGAEAPEPPSQRGSHRGSFCRRARADVARSSRRAAPRKR